MNDLKFKPHEVLVSVLVEAFSPQEAASVVRESLHTSVMVHHSHVIDVHEVTLPHRRRADNRHELQLEVELPVILKLESTGSGAKLNEPSILPAHTSDAVKE